MRTKQRNNLAETARHERVAQNTDVYAVKARNYKGLRRGSPVLCSIWWGIAAWPVDNFVKENDFTGKTVIPFCTAATSGIGDSGNLLEEMTGTGDWKEGERFHGGASESDISSWIDSLGL